MTSTIYIRLLNEGTTVNRSTQGEPLGGDRYRVLATRDYDPTDEEWEFLPGSVVVCETVANGSDRLLIARRLG